MTLAGWRWEENRRGKVHMQGGSLGLMHAPQQHVWGRKLQRDAQNATPRKLSGHKKVLKFILAYAFSFSKDTSPLLQRRHHNSTGRIDIPLVEIARGLLYSMPRSALPYPLATLYYTAPSSAASSCAQCPPAWLRCAAGHKKKGPRNLLRTGRGCRGRSCYICEG